MIPGGELGEWGTGQPVSGSLYSKEGQLVYTGGFVNGKYHGYGRTYENGKTNLYGVWVDGKLRKPLVFFPGKS